MSGPSLRTYKAGSIIYFIEDRGTEIYVLQKGRIILISNSLDNSTETKEDVQKGEFFGVKSALGAYPREETVQVLSDSVVLVFTPQLFEAFCMKNPRLVLQMLKVFSGQLRKVHRKVREILGDTGQDENSVELLRTAESFYKSGENDHAKYAFNAFLKNYSTSSFAGRAQSMLKMISMGQPYPIELDSIDNLVAKIRSGEGDPSFTTADLGNSFSSDFQSTSVEAPELDNFSESADIPDVNLNESADIDDLDIPDLDIPDLDIPDYRAPSLANAKSVISQKSPVATSPDLNLSAPAINNNNITQLYYDGLNAFSKQDWNMAISNFEKALQVTKFENDAEASFLEKSLYELGRTYMKKGEIDKGLNKLSEFVKKYARSDNLKKAMIFLAEGYLKKGDKQRTLALLNKVSTMPPRDKDSAYAKAQLDRLMKK